MSSARTLTPMASYQLSDRGVDLGRHVFPEADVGTGKDNSYGKPQTGWRRVVYGFTPNWFSVTMGTGIVSILLFDIPFQGSWLFWLSVVVSLLNILIFVVFLVITVLRYSLYPHLIRSTLQNLSHSLFFGMFPIGLSTIITMVAQLGEPAFGQSAVNAAWILWWIDVFLSLVCCFTMPFLIMHNNKNELRFMTAAWLLPIIPTIVASATGAVIAGLQSNAQHALWTLTTCYILWGCGVPLAMSILVIYLTRMTFHKFPPKETMVSVFLPLGPLGQGAFAIQRLGAVARDVFAQTNTLNHASTGSGNILYALGWAIAIPMLGYAVFWLIVAIAHVCSSRFPFNLGWWAFTFPLGTIALATITIGAEMPSVFFDIVGTVLTTAVVLLWILCLLQTAHHAWNGHLFAVH